MSFVATRSDLDPGIRAVEAIAPRRYVAGGFYTTADVEVFSTALDIPELGKLVYLVYQFGKREVREGNHASSQEYYVFSEGETIHVDRIPQNKGGVLYLVDGRSNPNAFVLRPGGMDRLGRLVGGYVSEGPEGNAVAVEGVRQYVSALTSGFESAQSQKPTGGKERIRVGPEAMEMLLAGKEVLNYYALPVFPPKRRRLYK